MLAVVILSIPQLDLLSTADLIDWIFIILFPNYSLGQGLNDLYSNSAYNEICGKLVKDCYDKPKEPNPCCKDIANGRI